MKLDELVFSKHSKVAMDLNESSKSFESPSVKNARGKRVTSAQRIMIINTFKSFDGSFAMRARAQKTYHEVSELLGIGVHTIQKVITEYEVHGTVTSPKKTKNRTASTIFAQMDESESARDSPPKVPKRKFQNIITRTKCSKVHFFRNTKSSNV